MGVPGLELQDPRILQTFVESGLLAPDLPLTNHSIELRLWVPWPADRTGFSLYKIDQDTRLRYGGASGLMMEVEHTKTNFYPQLPDTVWENAPHVAWQTLFEHVEDFMNIIIRTQHLRQCACNLLPDGDPRWVAYFKELLEHHYVEKEESTIQDSHRVLLVCLGGLLSPIEMLTQCLHKNLDQHSNITEITMVIEDCVEFESEELGALIAASPTPINLDVNIASPAVIAEIVQHHRAHRNSHSENLYFGTQYALSPYSS